MKDINFMTILEVMAKEIQALKYENEHLREMLREAGEVKRDEF